MSSKLAFPPDSKTVNRVVPSPNHSTRRDGIRPDILLLHYTGMQTSEAALHRLCDPHFKVSSHYMVFEDGEIVQLVPESLRAQHAGISHWAGDTDINSRSVGIEIGNGGHDWGYPDFPARQISAVIELCRDIIARYGIRRDFVLAHSDVAPTRKQDPGEKFPWKTLYDAGVGLWVAPAPIAASGGVLKEGDTGEVVSELQKQLSSYGYGLPTTGTYDALTKAVVTAFQLHFRPAQIDGIADSSTMATLRTLLAARAALAKS
jgi:N-acetylmuramoyl-L-alanine amidase